MIRTTEVYFLRVSTPVLLGGLILFTACSDSSTPGNGGSEKGAVGGVGNGGMAAAGTGTNSFHDARIAEVTNQLAVIQREQNALIDQLQKRLAQLERRDEENQALVSTARQERDDLAKTHEEQSQKLTRQIAGLQGQIQSLQDGRVLPEIVIAADDSPTTQELDQKLRIAERRNELAEEAAEARLKEAPRLSVGPGGFAFSSANGDFSARIRGLVQLDSRQFIDDNPLSEGNDSFLLRRARPILEATLFRDFDFTLVPEFGGSSPTILDAYVNYRFTPELQLRAGKFKTPLGFEQLQSDSVLPFNERSLVSNLVPNRDVGVQLWGELADGQVTYALAVLNGTGDGRNAANVDFDDDKEFAGRIFAQPLRSLDIAGLKGIGIGLAGTYSQISSNVAGLPATTGGTLPGYSTDGQQQFFAFNPTVGTVVADGAQWRLSPQISYLWGPFGLLGEYALSHLSVYNGTTFREAELNNTAWQISAQWVLTGEPASFTGITPLRPFSFRSGGWGAWQLVGRFAQLKIDDEAFQGFSNPATSASAATSWSVGVNWWLNRNFRILTSFSHTTFEGGGGFNPADASTFVPPATVTHQPENVFFTRLQLSF